MKKLILVSLLAYITIDHANGQANKKADPNKYLFIGTYTTKGSEGIYVYKFNTQTGDFKQVSIAKGIENPSFLAISPNKKFVYAVNEIGNMGGVAAFAFNKKSGQLAFINSSTANGDHPCHLEMNADGKHLAVGNYTGGNLCLFETNTDGSLKANPQIIQHEGHSINKDRQEKSHVHSVNWAPNQKDLFVPDLGQDKIFQYTLNKQTGKLESGIPEFTNVKEGTGPRHFTFHPNGKFAYVIQEMGNLVTSFDYKNGSLKESQSISTIPSEFKALSYCADIHISPDGKFLYGSNRGHNSLAIFSINQISGKLTSVDIQSVLGEWPRNFMIDPTGNFVLAANQNTDNVVIFKRNKITGKLTATGKEIKVSMPVCLKMM